ncbi:MAG TPA: ABC transporter ATP-binding protein [Acidimicrobiales bacterium]
MVKKLRAARLLAAYPFRIDAWRSGAGVVLIFVSQASAIVASYGLKFVTNAVVDRRASGIVDGLVVLGIAVVVTIAGSWAAFIIRAGMTDRTLLAVDSELAELSSSIVGVAHYEQPDILDRLQEVSENRQNLAGLPNTLATGAAVGLRLVITVAVLAGTKPVLGLLPLFLAPAIVATLVGRRWYNRAWDHIWPLWRMQLAIFGLGSTEPAGREIRTFGIQREIRRRHTATFDEADRMLADVQLKISLTESLGWAVFGAGFTGALVVIAHSATSGGLSAGDLVLIVALATQLNGQVGLLANSLGSTSGAFRTAEHFAWLVEYARGDEQAAGAPVEPPVGLRAGIELRDVSFSYPGSSDAILEGVDLLLPAGKTVAIVGENGAGKTTIAKLLLRMYEPTAGQILVDGVDLARIDASKWRAETAAGFQDFTRFEFLARQVVGVGDLSHIEHEPSIRDALERAGATDVLSALDDDLALQLGRKFDEGRELSGGQWQKLALGRAMMRRAPLLLILDEPTASLDAITEAQLFERYGRAARVNAGNSSAVTLLVSHRFSTVRLADLIVVLDRGRVVEQGSHEELLALGGLYAELFTLQARAYR